MEDARARKISFTILNETMEKAQRKAVVEHALNHWKVASPGVRQRLERVIRESLKIPGFHRDATRAPVCLLAGRVVAISHGSSDLMGAVLWVWTTTQPAFLTAARQFLVARDIPVVSEEGLERGFPSRWPVEEAERAAEDFLTGHPEYNKPDAALMLCCLTGRAPWPEGLEMEEEQGEAGEELADGGKDNKVNWERWLDVLRALPADASEWEGVDRFVEAVQQLAAEKQGEKEGWGKLREELAALTDQCAEEIGFFSLPGVSTWTSERAPKDDAERLAIQVKEFRERLIEYRQLRKQAGSTYQEDRQLLERRASLGEQILSICRELAPSPSRFDSN